MTAPRVDLVGVGERLRHGSPWPVKESEAVALADLIEKAKAVKDASIWLYNDSRGMKIDKGALDNFYAAHDALAALFEEK